MEMDFYSLSITVWRIIEEEIQVWIIYRKRRNSQLNTQEKD